MIVYVVMHTYEDPWSVDSVWSEKADADARADEIDNRHHWSHVEEWTLDDGKVAA